MVTMLIMITVYDHDEHNHIKYCEKHHDFYQDDYP